MYASRSVCGAMRAIAATCMQMRRAWLLFGLVRKNEFALYSTQRAREILLALSRLVCRLLLTMPTLIASNMWESCILCAWVAKPRLRVKFFRFKKSLNKRGYKSRRIIRRVFGRRLLSCRKDVPISISIDKLFSVFVTNWPIIARGYFVPVRVLSKLRIDR